MPRFIVRGTPRTIMVDIIYTANSSHDYVRTINFKFYIVILRFGL